MKGISLHAPLFIYSVRLKGASGLRTFTSPHAASKLMAHTFWFRSTE